MKGKGSSLNVLILDDSAEDAALLSRRLRATGLRAIFQTARTEVQYRIALGTGIDVIFADALASRLSVPRALDLLQRLKLDIPFIVLCKGTDQCGLDEIARQATDLIPKDRLDLARAALDRALRHRAEREELAAQLARAEKMALIGEVVTGFASELTDVLGRILADANLALDKESAGREAIARIRRSAEHALLLCRNLPEPQPPRTSAHPRPATVLLVEEDRTVRQLTALGLVRHGYRILQAGTAAEAVQLYSGDSDGIDLLITERILSGPTSGTELAARLRQEKPSLKVIFLSDEEVIPGAALPGAESTRILPKQSTVSALIKAVREFLEAPASP
jgi:DNA-binding NtrC family response regulator